MMQLSNFSVNDNYAIEFGNIWLDLHNDYDFESVRYDSSSNSLIMEWRQANGHSSAAGVTSFALRFNSVQFLKTEILVKPTSTANAKTLEYIGFLHPDDADVMNGCLLQEEADESYHLIFHFENGLSIKCFCDEVIFELSS